MILCPAGLERSFFNVESAGRDLGFLHLGTTNKQETAVRAFSPLSRILDGKHEEINIYSLLLSGYPEGSFDDIHNCKFRV